MTNKTAKAELRRLRDEVITSGSPFYGGGKTGVLK